MGFGALSQRRLAWRCAYANECSCTLRRQPCNRRNVRTLSAAVRPDGGFRDLHPSLSALTRATASTGGVPEASRERVSVLPAVGTGRHSARCFSEAASHAPSAMATPAAGLFLDRSKLQAATRRMRWFVVADGAYLDLCRCLTSRSGPTPVSEADREHLRLSRPRQPAEFAVVRDLMNGWLSGFPRRRTRIFGRGSAQMILARASGLLGALSP